MASGGIGVAVITRRLHYPSGQAGSLAHPEPVLFVDHGKAQVTIDDILRDQAWADNDLCRAVGEACQDRLASAGASLAKKKMRFMPSGSRKRLIVA